MANKLILIGAALSAMKALAVAGVTDEDFKAEVAKTPEADRADLKTAAETISDTVYQLTDDEFEFDDADDDGTEDTDGTDDETARDAGEKADDEG